MFGRVGLEAEGYRQQGGGGEWGKAELGFEGGVFLCWGDGSRGGGVGRGVGEG